MPKVESQVPRAPDGLLASTRRDWREFWQSPKGHLVTPENRPALERLFRMRDDLERESEIYRQGRLVTGSVGQIRMNPLAGHILALEAAIVRLETEFGLTPLSASRLGLMFGEASRSLEDLNRRLREQATDGEEQHDPYAALLEPDRDGGGPQRPRRRASNARA
jgi:P27 family predicted phage terminase small subunit